MLNYPYYTLKYDSGGRRHIHSSIIEISKSSTISSMDTEPRSFVSLSYSRSIHNNGYNNLWNSCPELRRSWPQRLDVTGLQRPPPTLLRLPPTFPPNLTLAAPHPARSSSGGSDYLPGSGGFCSSPSGFPLSPTNCSTLCSANSPPSSSLGCTLKPPP